MLAAVGRHCCMLLSLHKKQHGGRQQQESQACGHSKLLTQFVMLQSKLTDVELYTDPAYTATAEGTLLERTSTAAAAAGRHCEAAVASEPPASRLTQDLSNVMMPLLLGKRSIFVKRQQQQGRSFTAVGTKTLPHTLGGYS